MHWIYLSPHLDDVVYSCGGLVWEQTQLGDHVEIWTICAGSPPPGPLTPFAELLHERWGTGPEAIAVRREEDRQACRLVGAVPHLVGLPDCIYRRLPDGEPVVQGEEDLWNPLHPAEIAMAERLAGELSAAISTKAILVSPLGLGQHIDHRLTIQIAAQLAKGDQFQQIYYYADYPYVVRHPEELNQVRQNGYRPLPPGISGEGLHIWQAAVAAHASQLTTFWRDRADLDQAIESYWQAGGGGLWEKVISSS